MTMIHQIKINFFSKTLLMSFFNFSNKNNVSIIVSSILPTSANGIILDPSQYQVKIDSPSSTRWFKRFFQ